MTVIDELFERTRAENRAALVGYLPVGYPDVPTSYEAFAALCGRPDSPGVDLVEVGLPYSDPMMDGPVIQRAGTSALARGVRTRDVFGAVEAVAATGTPAVAMTYWLDTKPRNAGPEYRIWFAANADGFERNEDATQPNEGVFNCDPANVLEIPGG